ncbi:MAG: signal recognition particle-docking protein FtsY [Snowella sp.]|nr:signal recognition particle-docking protein FtsY [Snowella sp.]
MFNWFRRQFGDSSQSEQTPVTPDSTPTVEESSQGEEVTQETETSADNSQDAYLEWAKSAFKNIQERKQSEEILETPEPVAEEVVSQEIESAIAEPEVEAEPETVTESEVEPEIELVAETESVPSIELIVETESVTEAEPVPEIAEIEPEIEIKPEIPVSTPAWLQKSDRLEILKETAIETEVPETPPQPVVRKKGIKFDDDFIWSAKVLADQGRAPEDISEEEINWLSRLRQGLTKTRRNLVNQLKAIVGQGPLNQAAVMEIESILLQADVGIEATDYIITALQNKLREEALPPDAAIAYLKTILREMLDRPLQTVSNADFIPTKETLNIWLLTGVNGAGKTTTIGKLAHLAQKSGYSCLIAAADTFRAAAVEQVKIWGDRSGTSVIANPDKNSDPAAVVFDGISAAQSRNIELLLVDTAGRLQNKKNLMDELAKIRRIIDKKAPNAQVESLLVLDATLGQNGLRQAEVFSQAAKLSGVVLTKLDGTAKGGVAIAVAQQLNLPIRFIGAGEGIEDLRPFSSYEFVEALLNG